MKDLDGLVHKCLKPFATSEPAMSSVLADARSVFLDAVADGEGDEATVRATVDRLRNAADLEILVEPFIANAGNLDVVLLSRSANAILAVENKTVSQLGKLQLTKYRVALQDSDPWPDAGPSRRAAATVLLRPSLPPDAAWDPDEANDPEGFRLASSSPTAWSPR